MSQGEAISTEKRGHILLIGLNRPEKRNAFTVKMYEELGRAYRTLEDDPELRCGVLFAHGDHFTAGLDLADFAGAFASGSLPVPEGAIDPMQLDEPFLTKPVVTAIQGICLTAGIELMLGTDIRIASENTKFAQIEIKRGIYPVGGATIRYVREAGWGNAMRYLLTGDEFSAEEALRIGLIQEVVPEGEHLNRALALAEVIAEQAPLGVSATLISARKALREGETAAVAALLPDLLPIMHSEDVQEGLMSFLERRKANFKGK